MNGTYKPLPIWHAGDPLGPDEMDRLKEAKLSLWLDYSVIPRVAHEGDIEMRVLAWGTPPPFVCAYALVDPAGSDEEVAKAVAWVLWEGEYAQAMEVEQQLGALLGPGVREIPADELEAERRYAAYEAGTE